jgi:hypothetical protein
MALAFTPPPPPPVTPSLVSGAGPCPPAILASLSPIGEVDDDDNGDDDDTSADVGDDDDNDDRIEEGVATKVPLLQSRPLTAADGVAEVVEDEEDKDVVVVIEVSTVKEEAISPPPVEGEVPLKVPAVLVPSAETLVALASVKIVPLPSRPPVVVVEVVATPCCVSLPSILLLCFTKASESVSVTVPSSSVATITSAALA